MIEEFYGRTFSRFVISSVFLAVVLFQEELRASNVEGKVTIVKEGIVPTAKELAETRIVPSLEVLGTLANPIVIASSAEAVYTEDGCYPYPFRMFLPKVVNPKKKYPLILWLHGLGESRGDNESQMMHMQTSIDVLAGPNRPDFYLVAVQRYSMGPWSQSDPRAPHGESALDMLDKIVQTLTRDYPIDPNRISLLGICDGVSAGYDLIREFPGRFSAFVAFSSTAPVEFTRCYSKLPIWMFNNSDDYIKPDRALIFAKEVNKNGGDAYVTIREGGHNTWTCGQRDDHVIEWLLRQKRGRFSFPRHVPTLDRSGINVFLMFAIPMTVILFSVTLFLKIRKRILD